MLDRLSNTTGENWSMLWPRSGEGLELLAILGVGAILIAVMSFVLQRFQILDFKFKIRSISVWLLAIVVLALSAITSARIANWNNVIDQRPDDLLSTFPVVLLLLLLAASGQRLTTFENQRSEIDDLRNYSPNQSQEKDQMVI